LLSLGVLFTIPVILFGQEPIAAPGETPSDDIRATASPTEPQDVALDPLTPGQKVRRRALRLVEPVTLFSSAFGAGIDQWRNLPPAWGQGSEGFARRFASAEGFTAAHNTIALGFDLALHLDPRYRRMPQARFGPRVWNAVSQTFIANKDSGGKMLNVSEIAGNFGAGFVANSWEPAGYNTTGDALTRGALGLAYHSAKKCAPGILAGLVASG